ncbi:hypothetical protein [Stagnihabitans tardus]|uniref:Uncharacterized protein n=1 Tax=Stagnihabitans tardus TaxID=2699202 RepID=A0AAE5BW08_9RHOB|nr:hypothetical protein [Stagnihabitans tardus]NBZ89526.1 hypothetical protein [Stagnihabitans tardus]
MPGKTPALLRRGAALGALCLLAAPVLAEPPPCAVNGPLPGLVPTGFPAMVTTPVDFDRVEVLGEGLAFFEGLQDPRHALVFSERAREGGPKAELRFWDGAGQVHACLLGSGSLAPVMEQPGAWAWGDCDFGPAGAAQTAPPPGEAASEALVLKPGERRLLQVSAPFAELSTDLGAGPGGLAADMGAVTDRQVRVEALRPGVGMLVFMDYEQDDKGMRGFSARLCPVRVAP